MSSGTASRHSRMRASHLSLLVLSVLTASTLGHQDSGETHTHRVVNPRLLHGRTKREIPGTEDSQEEGGHVHHLTVAWVLDDKDVLLDLKLNRDLLPESYREKYQHQGRAVVNKPTKQEVELCHYTGSLRDRPGSWAAISTCEGDGGLEGVIYD